MNPSGGRRVANPPAQVELRDRARADGSEVALDLRQLEEFEEPEKASVEVHTRVRERERERETITWLQPGGPDRPRGMGMACWIGAVSTYWRQLAAPKPALRVTKSSRRGWMTRTRSRRARL